MLAGNQLLAFTVTMCQHLNTVDELLQPDGWIFIEICIRELFLSNT